VIVEFSDFECPYCKESAKSMRANLLKTYPKEVHLYHIDMPLEGVHPWARAGSIAGQCIYRQNTDAFWNFYDWVYEHQAEITVDNLKAKVLEWAKTNDKIDSLKLSRCMEAKEPDAEITKSIEKAKELNVNQTPMFFVNGRRLAGAVEWPMLKHIVDEEIEYQKTAKNAGEDCGCSVTLPSAGSQTTPTLGGLK
jgi:protein-disulfide isomerase